MSPCFKVTISTTGKIFDGDAMMFTVTSSNRNAAKKLKY